MAALTPRNELLRTRLTRFTKMLHGVGEGEVRAIHQTRVASRRLRELIPVLQLDGAQTHKLVRRLRRVTRRLGGIRELDVLLLMLDELRDSRRYPPAALQRVREVVATRRQRDWSRLGVKKLVSELHRVSRKLHRVLDKISEGEQPVTERRTFVWAIDARVTRRAAALKQAIDSAGHVYLPERLHAVRIALKKMRYGAELAFEASGVPGAADLKLLKRMQELLGRMHDLQVLVDRVRRIQASLSPPDVVAWKELDSLVLGIEGSCRRLHARYVRERTGLAELCDRLGTRAAHPRPAARRAG